MGGDARVLVVDDEPEICELVRVYLEAEGLSVECLHDGSAALSRVRDDGAPAPDLAILDVMLPGASGLEVCRAIRERHSYPVIMLTARGEQADKICGLTLGADDYVTKPFLPLELVARVKAQLRRYTSYGTRSEAEEAAATLAFNGLVINRDARSVMVDEKPVRLTPLEYSILLYLAENRGRVVPVGELFRAVWDEEFMASSNNTVMVHIRHLREKIGDDAQNPRFIKNIWGVGYTIEK